VVSRQVPEIEQLPPEVLIPHLARLLHQALAHLVAHIRQQGRAAAHGQTQPHRRVAEEAVEEPVERLVLGEHRERVGHHERVGQQAEDEDGEERHAEAEEREERDVAGLEQELDVHGEHDLEVDEGAEGLQVVQAAVAAQVAGGEEGERGEVGHGRVPQAGEVPAEELERGEVAVVSDGAVVGGVVGEAGDGHALLEEAEDEDGAGGEEDVVEGHHDLRVEVLDGEGVGGREEDLAGD